MVVVHDVALLPARPASETQEAQGTIIVIREKHVGASDQRRTYLKVDNRQ
jgi:hypothetical protein